MAEHTGIEWCDATFNPWWGCEKVSPACAHCYADTLSKRYAGGVQLWGDGHEFRFFGDKHWAAPLKWARLLPAKLGRRPRVFCASMADVFEDRPELREPRERLLNLIYETPELDWLLLTKRPEVMRYHYYAGDWTITPNLWLGTSIENSRYTWRADALREIPAAVRFISAEPLLGSLFTVAGSTPARRLGVGSSGPDSSTGTVEQGQSGIAGTDAASALSRAPLNLDGIDWVIAGGESGPGARPTHPGWFRELRDACLGADQHGFVNCDACERFGPPDILSDSCQGNGGCGLISRPAFFFKQWGEWAPSGYVSGVYSEQHPSAKPSAVGTWRVYRFGKKVTGRTLDGLVWSEFPESKAAVPA